MKVLNVVFTYKLSERVYMSYNDEIHFCHGNLRFIIFLISHLTNRVYYYNTCILSFLLRWVLQLGLLFKSYVAEKQCCSCPGPVGGSRRNVSSPSALNKETGSGWP